MSSHSFTKLFSTLTASSIWSEDSDTKVVWITMLAMSDCNGNVYASLPGLSKIAGVSMENTLKAINKFKEPDIHSSSQEAEGRRIEVIDGGWKLINYVKYRKLQQDDERKEYQRNYWHKRKDSTKLNNTQQNSTDSIQAEAEAEAEAEADNNKKPPSPQGSPSDMPNDAERALIGKTKSTAKTVPALRYNFIKAWSDAYRARFGENYLHQSSKDDASADRLLSNMADVDALMSIVKTAWGNPSDFDYQQALTISGFLSRFNQIKIKALGKTSSIGIPNKMKATGIFAKK